MSFEVEATLAIGAVLFAMIAIPLAALRISWYLRDRQYQRDYAKFLASERLRLGEQPPALPRNGKISVRAHGNDPESEWGRG